MNKAKLGNISTQAKGINKSSTPENLIKNYFGQVLGSPDRFNP
jgi:hypothetical protein